VLEETFAVSSLLIGLHQCAARAAERRQKILDAAALEVVLLANVLALHGSGNPVDTEAWGAAEEEARSVDGLVAIEITVLAQTVVSLAEGNARNAASDQACVDWGEAREEGWEPALSSLVGARVDVLARSGENIVEAVLPVIDILVIDGTALGSLLVGHCVRCDSLHLKEIAERR
jgi:hypothetical protein